MKRNLLFSAVMLFGLAANASEYAIVDGVALGLNDSEVSAVAAGFVFASTDNVTMSNAFDDSYKIVSVNGPKDADDNSYKYFVVNGNVLNTSDSGLQGNSNPAGAATASFETPTSGAILQFDVKADGYIYVLFKGTSNKKYAAYENNDAIAYSLAMAYSGGVMSYTLEGDEYGYLSLDTYPSGIMFMEIMAGVSSETAEADGTLLKESGCAVAKFPVYAEAGKYLFFATGSKISFIGYYYDTTGSATVAVSTSEDGSNAITLMEGTDESPISNIVIESSSDAVVKTVEDGMIVIIKDGKKYNVAGVEIQ